jgi:Tfp pilus assembly PilM family ATPase
MALKGQPRSFLGINIGQALISLVELIDRGSRIELATYALANTPADLRNALATNNTTSIIQLARFITDVMEQASVSSDAAIFALPNTQIFSTTIELPTVPEKELSAAIFFKAQELIPTKLDKMIITATRPGETRHNVPLTATGNKCQITISQTQQLATPSTQRLKENTNSTTQFLINAIPASTVAWYQQLASALNLELIAVEAQIFPIMRIHPALGPGSTIFINIGQSETDIYVTDRQSVRINRTIDLAPVPNAPNRLIDEINLIISTNQEREGYRPSQIYLLGPGAMSADFKKSISSAFPIPINVSNPFSGLSFPQGLEQALAQKGPLFTVAMGLATRQISNL